MEQGTWSGARLAMIYVGQLQMRRRKYFIAIVSTFSVAVTTATLGCSISDANSYLITVYALQTSFAVYVLVLSLLSIRQEPHKESVLHLTALSTLAFVLFGLSAIMPLHDDTKNGSIMSLPCYTLSIIYAITSATCFTTALGPPLHYPPSNIYSDEVTNSIVNREEVNVCGAVGRMFRYTLLKYILPSMRRCIAPGYLIIFVHYKGDPVGECVIEPSDWRFAYLTC